jgi:hypothetical protein
MRLLHVLLATCLISTGAVAGLVVVLLFTSHPAWAAGVVGNGTPASCTDAALNTALTGGGLVTFNCGASPVTITATSTDPVFQFSTSK